MGIVIANEPKSEAGIEYHTPSRFQNNGKIYAIGNKRKSCRDSERKIETFTLPMHWKKFVITACEPTTKNTSMSILIPVADRSISVGSVVKMRAICRGNAIDNPHPTNRIRVAQTMVIHRHRNMRSCFSAP